MVGADSEKASAAELEDWRGLHRAPCLNGNHTPLLLKNRFTLKYGKSSLLLLRGNRGKETTFIVRVHAGAGLQGMALKELFSVEQMFLFFIFFITLPISNELKTLMTITTI